MTAGQEGEESNDQKAYAPSEKQAQKEEQSVETLKETTESKETPEEAFARELHFSNSFGFSGYDQPLEKKTNSLHIECGAPLDDSLADLVGSNQFENAQGEEASGQMAEGTERSAPLQERESLGQFESELSVVKEESVEGEATVEDGYSTDTDTCDEEEEKGSMRSHFTSASKRTVRNRPISESDGSNSEFTRRYKQHMKNGQSVGGFREIQGRNLKDSFKRFNSMHHIRATSKDSKKSDTKRLSGTKSKRLSRLSNGESKKSGAASLKSIGARQSLQKQVEDIEDLSQMAPEMSEAVTIGKDDIAVETKYDTEPLQHTVNMEYELPTRPATQDEEYDSDASVMSEMTNSENKAIRRYWRRQALVLFLLAVLVMIPAVAIRFLVKCKDTASGEDCPTVRDRSLAWCLMIAISLVGYCVAKAMVHLIVILVEQFYATNVNVIYYIFGIRRPLRWTFWSIITLIDYRFTLLIAYDADFLVSGKLEPVWALLICLVVTFIALTLKALAVKKMANGYHKKAYFERIQNSLHSEYALNQLSKTRVHRKSKSLSPKGPLKVISPADADAFEKSKNKLDAEGIAGSSPVLDVDAAGKSAALDELTEELLETQKDGKKVSEKQVHKLVTFIRDRSMIPVGMTSHLSHANSIDENDNNPRQAKHVAKKLFKKVKKPHMKVIEYEDFIPYFSREADCARAFAMFDVNGDATVSKREFVEGVQAIFKERKALSYSLSDTKTIVATLDTVFTVLIFFILFFVYLIIFGVDVVKFIIALAGIIAAFAFAFGESIKEVYENTIFIFVVHPFDIGDRITLPEGNSYVTSISLQVIEFDRWDGQKIYYRTTSLQNIPILNVNRSDHMWDTVTFDIDNRISNEKIRAIQSAIYKFLKDNPIDWYPEFDFVLSDIQKNNLISFSLWIQHRINFQSATNRYRARTTFYLYLKSVLEELDVFYLPPVQRLEIANAHEFAFGAQQTHPIGKKASLSDFGLSV
eukprot:Nk52_evm67s221 gene=Nk52_evmTU67s221